MGSISGPVCTVWAEGCERLSLRPDPEGTFDSLGPVFGMAGMTGTAGTAVRVADLFVFVGVEVTDGTALCDTGVEDGDCAGSS